MIEQLLTKEVVEPVFIIIIAVLSYILMKKIIVKTFMGTTKFREHKKSLTIMNLFVNIMKYIVLIAAVLALLNSWGVDTKAMLASLGIAGVVAGLALQDILKDFLAGFSIIVDNEYDVGDNIQVGTFRGDVIELGMKNTKIRAYTGEVMVIANRNVTDVINYSIHPCRSIIDISVSYEDKSDAVVKAIDEICEKLNKTTDYLISKTELLGIQELADSAVVYRIVAECQPLKDFEFKRKAFKVVKEVFDQKNISIPYPQVVAHSMPSAGDDS